jgi:hypothetical protein
MLPIRFKYFLNSLDVCSSSRIPPFAYVPTPALRLPYSEHHVSFFNLVLLTAVREDIGRNKRLNYHYYMALKKSIFKPAAFFKGVLLPMAQDGCTAREATILYAGGCVGLHVCDGFFVVGLMFCIFFFYLLLVCLCVFTH